MTLCDIIQEIFESEEMSRYLCANADGLYKWQIREMIAASPMVTLQRKWEIFDWLAGEEDIEKELTEAEDERERKWILEDSYAAIAKGIRSALDALYDMDKPAVFLVENIVCHEKNSDASEEYGKTPFASFEKAAAHIKAESAEFDEGARFWYSAEKWEPDENGDMNETWEYLIINNQIMFFYSGMHDCDAKPDRDLNLPIPFQPGDIIEAHSLPISRRRRALILEVNDNWDCCAVQHIYVGDDGSLRLNALKHGHLFEDSWVDNSPLYTIKKYAGVLEEGEEALALIQSYMKKRPEIDRNLELWDAIKYIEEQNIPPSEITEALLDSLVEKMREKRNTETQ